MMLCEKCSKAIGLDEKPCCCESDPESRLHRTFVVPVKGRPISYVIRFCPVCGKELKNGVTNYPAA